MESKHYKELQRYIEETPWDEWLDKNEKYLERFCIGVIIFAVIYFGTFTVIGLISMR